jgi:hypothetical protein
MNRCDLPPDAKALKYLASHAADRPTLIARVLKLPNVYGTPERAIVGAIATRVRRSIGKVWRYEEWLRIPVRIPPPTTLASSLARVQQPRQSMLNATPPELELFPHNRSPCTPNAPPEPREGSGIRLMGEHGKNHSPHKAQQWRILGHTDAVYALFFHRVLHLPPQHRRHG